MCFRYLIGFPFYNQVFYYLGELNDALSYALGAGPLFDVSEDTDYAHTLLGLHHILTSCLTSFFFLLFFYTAAFVVIFLLL